MIGTLQKKSGEWKHTSLRTTAKQGNPLRLSNNKRGWRIKVNGEAVPDATQKCQYQCEILLDFRLLPRLPAKQKQRTDELARKGISFTFATRKHIITVKLSFTAALSASKVAIVAM